MDNHAHDVALICHNGHVINDHSKLRPQNNHNFCEKCGEPTISKCESCAADIPGALSHEAGTHHTPQYHAPAYCPNCGTAFPWTHRKKAVAHRIIDELEELDETDKEKLKSNLPHLIADTPQSELARKHTRTILGRLGNECYEIAKAVLVTIVSEASSGALFD